MSVIKHIFFLLAGCLLVITGKTQNFNPRFEQLPGDVVLSHTSITNILQDHQGFLWLGTWWGLIKYDGYNAKQYKQEPGNINGLESNKINILFEDSKKRLWVGTHNTGFYQYDPSTDLFIQYKKDPANANSLSNNRVWAIQEDSYGYLWIGTEKGLNRFDPKTRKFIHFNHNSSDDRSLGHDFVNVIWEAQDRSLWIGTEGGLDRLIRKENHEPNHFIQYSLAPVSASEKRDEFIAHNYIYQIKQVENQPTSLWIGTKGGLKKIGYSKKDLEKLEIHTYRNNPADDSSLSHNFVVDIWEVPDGNLWVATYNGLNLLKKDSDQFQRFVSDSQNAHSLQNNVIKALFLDRSDLLWIGTEGGLHKLNLSAKPFFNIQIGNSENSSNQYISTVINSYDSSGLWLGTRGGGLNYLPLSQQSSIPKQAQQFLLDAPYQSETAGFISGLMVDKEGWLWATTLGAGVLKMKESKLLSSGPTFRDLLQFYVGDGIESLGDEHLMSITPSASGDIWFGGWDVGLVRYDREKDRFIKYRNTVDQSIDLQAFPIVHLKEAKENHQEVLWVGTRGNGLLKLQYDPNKDVVHALDKYINEVDQNGSISNNYINCLFTDSKDRFWIGTENGLNLFHSSSNTFIRFLEADGLVHSMIQSIVEDKKGRLWVSTLRGISRFTQQADSMNWEIKNFDAYDGLQDNFFYDDAAGVTPNGELAFGGSKGLSFFSPDRIQEDTVAPQIAITDFRLFNKSIPIGELEDGRVLLEKSIQETSKIDISYRDRVVSFEFVGLHFVDPNKIQYAYKLEGFDPDWVYTDASHRIAQYTNLSNNEFTFQVKAANGDGVWSQPVSIQITVHPPFWKTKWAFLLFNLLFFSLLYGAFRLTNLRAEFRHRLQLERLEKEKLEEVNQLKLRFFTNISHELRTPLTLIISPLEELVKEKRVDKKLHTSLSRMFHNANRLLNMINQLLDIRKSEAGLMKLKVAEGNIVKFIKEVVLSFKGLAMQRQIKLSFLPSEDKILLWYDRDQMEKVMFNLLSNALKFTPEGGEITVSVQKDEGNQIVPGSPDSVTISVKDSGAGIPPKDIPHIFDRFYQVEISLKSAKKGGTGIGLALSKSIVEAHHGKIWAESIPDRGAQFFVQLPRGEAHFKPDEKISNFEDSESITNYLTRDAELEKSLLSSSTKEVIPNKEKRPILLLVEDNPEIRNYLGENLQADYSIEEAGDGSEGLKKALANPPDLILADISMPVMDGIEMCAKLKTDIKTSHIPVILLTARTSLIFKIDGLETGADDYITKPFNMQLLKTRIKNLIDSRQKLQKSFAKNFDLSPSGIVMNSVDEQFLSQIKLLIEKNIDNSGYSVEQLASALHMSRMQLYRKLKALTDKTPIQVIRSIRLKRAAQLLESQQYNVADVTYMVGYNDLKSFREQFKKEFGVSPSKYKV